MTDSDTTASCQGASWSYDTWGNRLGQTATKGSCLAPQFTFNANNQIITSGFVYDAAGNMTHDANHSYTFDAENRITAVDGGNTATYSYDALGRRVEKTTAGTTTDFLYDLSGRVVAEQPQGALWGPGYVYFGGSLLAQYGNSTTYFVHGDHLGSTHLMTNLSGTIYDNYDYLPFGEQIAGGSGTTHKFTGKERDSESNLDDFGGRYYSSSTGRWMSPDWSAIPEPVPYANLTNPQTLNLYAMVHDNPESFADLDGHVIGAIGWGAATGTLTFPDFVDDAWSPGFSIDELGCLANHALCNSGELVAQEQNQTSSPTPPPTESGINPNYKLPTFDVVLKKTSDFSAGAGDFLSFGLTEKFREHYGYNNVVDQHSVAYAAGLGTGIGVAAAGSALGIAKVTAGLETKIAIHGAEHAFGTLGNLPHLQIMWWIAGAAGTGQSMGGPIRIPLAPLWPQ